MADLTPEEFLIAAVETDAQRLCGSVHAATDAGVSEALLLPALISVFREAGMIPQDLDFGSLLSMLK